VAVTQAQARLALANLLGEETVSGSWPSSRDNAIQLGLERISRMYDFDFGRTTATASTNASGVATLDNTVFRQDARMDVRIAVAGTGNDFVFQPVEQFEFDNYAQGNYRYYLATSDAGVMTLVTTEPSQTLTITGSRVAPVLSATVSTNFPSAEIIANAALIFVRRGEDKDADIAPEDAIFRQSLGELVGAENRARAPRRARSLQEQAGQYTGQVRDDYYRRGY
jgi:hypothetical protein